MDVTGVYTEVFIRWLECAEKGVAPVIHGDGSATMDFVYCKDIARANILAMQSDRSDDVYNVASGKETSLLELWEAIRDVVNAKDLLPTFVPPRSVNAVPRRLADTRRAKEEIGFAASTPLPEGLQQLAEWRKRRLEATPRTHEPIGL
jgi:UDP-glucose 4-epimerase